MSQSQWFLIIVETKSVSCYNQHDKLNQCFLIKLQKPKLYNLQNAATLLDVILLHVTLLQLPNTS